MPKNPAAVALGRLGGLATKGITSRKKAAAARRNGKKGGRPKSCAVASHPLPTPEAKCPGDGTTCAREAVNDPCLGGCEQADPMPTPEDR